VNGAAEARELRLDALLNLPPALPVIERHPIRMPAAMDGARQKNVAGGSGEGR